MMAPLGDPFVPDEEALYEIKRIGEEWQQAMRSIDRRAERAHLGLAAAYIRNLLKRPEFSVRLSEMAGNLEPAQTLSIDEDRYL